MKNYLCANRHHFRAPTAQCPSPGCAAEVRPTALHPLQGDVPSFAHLPKLADPPPPPPTAHRIRWWAYVGGERVPRASSMKDKEFGWDATCVCGWDSRTGGATMASVDQQVQEHKRG